MFTYSVEAILYQKKEDVCPQTNLQWMSLISFGFATYSNHIAISYALLVFNYQ